MELNKTRNPLYLAIFFAMLFLLTLGAWWLYLVSKLSFQLEKLDASNNHHNLLKMVQWEGVTFLVLAILITFAIGYIFWLDSKKTHALQSFFASLTHELKTPLASINLQSQVLQDYIETNVTDQSLKTSLSKYTARLHKDCFKLEDELNKHLELSRVENLGYFAPKEVELLSLIRQEASHANIALKINSQVEELLIEGQEHACRMIFKNLFENSLRHNKNFTHAHLDIKINSKTITINYHDHGQDFNGTIKHLGKIFYKHNSPKGSGIGLYIVKKLMQKMRGHLVIQASPTLIFTLVFKRVQHA